MKKLLFLGIVALTGCLWADRTANQGWVAKNFAPSNLVTRVKALEDAPAPSESDPIFMSWAAGPNVQLGKNTSSSTGAVAIGSGVEADSQGAVGIGTNVTANGYRSIAIGCGASATAADAVQIGMGENDAAGTLKFGEYILLMGDGKIPEFRLPSIATLETDPQFEGWKGGETVSAGYSATADNVSVAIGMSSCAVGGYSVAVGGSAQATLNGALALGSGSLASASGAIAIGSCATATANGAVQIGPGGNAVAGSVNIGNRQILDADGKIPSARLPAITETDPLFTAWQTNSNVAVGKDAFSSGDGVAVGNGTQAQPGGIGIGQGASAGSSMAIAIGAGANAAGESAVQIGTGSNAAANTLQFRDYTIVDANGKIPSERLPAITEQDPAFFAWRDSKNVEAGYYAVAGNGAIAIGNQASAQAVEAIGIGDGSMASGGGSIAIGWGAMTGADGAVQLGLGSNTTSDTLQFRDYTIVDANGKIPSDRLTPAAILSAIQAMSAEQKAAVKTALGL